MSEVIYLNPTIPMSTPSNTTSALFDNALDSIQMGVEDYALKKPARSLSAVRNFYAGLLLLAKEALARQAPMANLDDVIGARFKPVPDGTGGVAMVPDGHQTIDFVTIAKRFKDFGIPLDKASEAALKELNTVRNEIEHRYTNKPSDVVREVIARAFPLTVQLFRITGEDPRTRLSGVWPTMLEARDLYAAELLRCRETVRAIDWHSSTVEAHLHAQVQQVFIKEAYGVLRRHDRLGGAKTHRTQLVVSTHSSHIAHACEFECLRYFRRRPADAASGAVPLANVINLSSVFGGGDATARFVTRYLKATHCDLFFADGAILLEGPAERILAPHFVQTRPDYDHLRRCYVSWLEVGGSHAHRLRPLLHALALPTLIVTDLDAKDAKSHAAVPPQRGMGQLARNETLKTWVPKEEQLDVLLDAKLEDKVHTDDTGYAVRVAYQQPREVSLKGAALAEALANTFEDALVYENLDIFQQLEGTGLIAKFRDAIAAAPGLAELAADVQKFLVKGKAEFALNLLYATYKKTTEGVETDADVVDDLVVPTYIHEGLLWLSGELERRELELPPAAAA